MPHTTRSLIAFACFTLSICPVQPAVGQTVDQVLKIIANDGAEEDYFGLTIAAENELVCVGAFLDDDLGNKSGSAYIFDLTTGEQLHKLLPNDGTAGAEFGWSVDMDDGLVAVAAVGDPVFGSASGSAYVFDASTGEQLFKLVPNDGMATANFGWSIAIENGIVAVGAIRDGAAGFRSGAAYLFDAQTGEQLFKLPPDKGSANDNFGWSIDINNGIVAVGARSDNVNGTRSGSAYLFDASTGTRLFRLIPDDGAEFDEFARSITIQDGIVAVGAYRDDDDGLDSGSVYLFDALTGMQIRKILPDDGDDEHEFGWSVDIDNDILAIGARGDTVNGENSGSAYLFQISTGDQLVKIIPSDGAFRDFFGQSINVYRNTVSIGALWDDETGTNSGSAYIYSLTTSQDCPADLTGDGSLDFFDISAFLVAFSVEDSVADFEPDGVYDFFDVSVFLAFYTKGCP